MGELLISILYNTWSNGYIYLLYDLLMEKRRNWTVLRTLSLFVLISSFFTIMGEYLLSNYNINDSIRLVGLLLRLVLTISAFLIFFHGTIIKKVFSVIFAVILICISELIAVLFYTSRHQIESIDGIVAQDTNIIAGLAVIIAYLYVFMIKWTRGNKGLSIKSTSINLMLMVIPIASVCTLFYTYRYFDNREIGIISIFIYLVNLTAYFLFNKLEHYYKEIRDYEVQEQQYRLRETYYQQMELHQKEIRTIKHDLQNQLIALNASFQNELTSEDNPLNSLIDQLSQQTECDFTSHPGINAVLGVKYRQTQQQSIICKWEVKVPTDVRFKDTDLASVLGNVLDNAIEACQYCTGTSYIQFQMIYHNGSLVINSENSTDGQSGDFKTRKKDKKNHGLGIESIRSVVDKYHGEMQQSFSLHCYQIELTLFEPKIL